MLMQVAAQANLGSSVRMPQVALLADAARKKMKGRFGLAPFLSVSFWVDSDGRCTQVGARPRNKGAFIFFVTLPNHPTTHS